LSRYRRYEPSELPLVRWLADLIIWTMRGFSKIGT
jgi:hypothetical protein